MYFDSYFCLTLHHVNKKLYICGSSYFSITFKYSTDFQGRVDTWDQIEYQPHLQPMDALPCSFIKSSPIYDRLYWGTLYEYMNISAWITKEICSSLIVQNLVMLVHLVNSSLISELLRIICIIFELKYAATLIYVIRVSMNLDTILGIFQGMLLAWQVGFLTYVHVETLWSGALPLTTFHHYLVHNRQNMRVYALT